MSFDGLFTHAMVHELSQLLTGGRVARINQPYPAEMVMVVRANRKNHPLLISANPTYPRLQITAVPYKNPAVPSNFTMTLRKYLEGALIDSISQVDNDRIVEFTFTTRDELGDTQHLKLIVEIMARNSNVSLVNQETGKIIDTIKHVGSDQNRVRLLLPGALFRMPPKQERTNPYLPNQHYPKLFSQFQGDQAGLAKALQHQYQGFGKDSAAELAAELLAADNLPTAYEGFLRHFEHPEPVLIEDQQGKQRFEAFPPLDPTGLTITHFATLSELLDGYYAAKAEHDRTKELAGQVLKVVNNELKKDKRKVKKLNQELADAESADDYRIRGELLTTYLGQLKAGMTEIELPNFYDENRPLQIQLAPELSPSKNAQRYFTRYNKLKASVAYDQEQLALANEEINYFENIVSQINIASPADVQEIRLELEQQGYLRVRRQKGKKQRKVQPAKPELFHTSDGSEVLVGKNNLQNDRLSFKLANKNDLWFHVKDIPGSHVVLRNPAPSDETILEVAQLAAYFSKGRDSDNVPVDYLPVKRLHKPNGAKPGFVTFRGQKTLSVTPKRLPN